MVIDNENILLIEPFLCKKQLLSRAQVTKDLKRVIFRHLVHGEGFELPYKDRSYLDPCPG